MHERMYECGGCRMKFNTSQENPSCPRCRGKAMFVVGISLVEFNEFLAWKDGKDDRASLGRHNITY